MVDDGLFSEGMHTSLTWSQHKTVTPAVCSLSLSLGQTAAEPLSLTSCLLVEQCSSFSFRTPPTLRPLLQLNERAPLTLSCQTYLASSLDSS